MSADSGAWNDSSRHDGALKVARGPDGTLYGTVGHAPECAAFLAWVHAGCREDMPLPTATPDRESSFVVIAVSQHGPVRIISAYGEERYHAPYFAIGAGAPCAWGALYAGADAITAVHAAIAHSDGAAGHVCTITH
jgi:hypothetical protein